MPADSAARATSAREPDLHVPATTNEVRLALLTKSCTPSGSEKGSVSQRKGVRSDFARSSPNLAKSRERASDDSHSATPHPGIATLLKPVSHIYLSPKECDQKAPGRR